MGLETHLHLEPCSSQWCYGIYKKNLPIEGGALVVVVAVI